MKNSIKIKSLTFLTLFTFSTTQSIPESTTQTDNLINSATELQASAKDLIAKMYRDFLPKIDQQKRELIALKMGKWKKVPFGEIAQQIGSERASLEEKIKEAQQKVDLIQQSIRNIQSKIQDESTPIVGTLNRTADPTTKQSMKNELEKLTSLDAELKKNYDELTSIRHTIEVLAKF